MTCSLFFTLWSQLTVSPYLIGHHRKHFSHFGHNKLSTRTVNPDVRRWTQPPVRALFSLPLVSVLQFSLNTSLPLASVLQCILDLKGPARALLSLPLFSAYLFWRVPTTGVCLSLAIVLQFSLDLIPFANKMATSKLEVMIWLLIVRNQVTTCEQTK
jgi:hypothetical protein